MEKKEGAWEARAAHRDSLKTTFILEKQQSGAGKADTCAQSRHVSHAADISCNPVTGSAVLRFRPRLVTGRITARMQFMGSGGANPEHGSSSPRMATWCDSDSSHMTNPSQSLSGLTLHYAPLSHTSFFTLATQHVGTIGQQQTKWGSKGLFSLCTFPRGRGPGARGQGPGAGGQGAGGRGPGLKQQGCAERQAWQTNGSAFAADESPLDSTGRRVEPRTILNPSIHVMGVSTWRSDSSSSSISSIEHPLCGVTIPQADEPAPAWPPGLVHVAVSVLVSIAVTPAISNSPFASSPSLSACQFPSRSLSTSLWFHS
ncbi:hypothetical protein P4O66_011094 [Electrophorus voltai]|uniref:Uncharacterized protein n=1 Tax=Electrophorus voltai TaxID=2609070 RepID=A0AAD9DVD5_9TELE|nr:hypothetical protein P4O66_011094 [Electrophorus voltai]